MSIVTVDASIIAVVDPAHHFMNEVLPRIRAWSNHPAHKALLRYETAQKFFNDLPKQTSAWIQRIQHLRIYSPLYLKDMVKGSTMGTAFQSAWAQLTAQESVVAHAARMAALNSAAAGTKGTLVAGAGTTALCVVVPLVGMVAVQMALGAGYAQAREQARKDGYASGFAKGLITGFLKWELRFAIERLWDNALDKNPYDEELPKIRANAHNQALIHGRVAGWARTDEEKKAYLLGLSKLTKTSTAGWVPQSTGNDYKDWLQRERSQVVQRNYVIDLAGTATKYGFTAVF